MSYCLSQEGRDTWCQMYEDFQAMAYVCGSCLRRYCLKASPSKTFWSALLPPCSPQSFVWLSKQLSQDLLTLECSSGTGEFPSPFWVLMPRGTQTPSKAGWLDHWRPAAPPVVQLLGRLTRIPWRLGTMLFWKLWALTVRDSNESCSLRGMLGGYIS